MAYGSRKLAAQSVHSPHPRTAQAARDTSGGQGRQLHSTCPAGSGDIAQRHDFERDQRQWVGQRAAPLGGIKTEKVMSRSGLLASEVGAKEPGNAQLSPELPRPKWTRGIHDA